MTLDEILVMWKKDVVIDDVCLDEETLKSSKLHAKYLELYSMAKLQLKKKEMELDSMKKDKWLYYNGKMSQQDMDNRKWKYDPFDGMTKPLKSDMEMYYDTYGRYAYWPSPEFLDDRSQDAVVHIVQA